MGIEIASGGKRIVLRCDMCGRVAGEMHLDRGTFVNQKTKRRYRKRILVCAECWKAKGGS